MGRRTCILCGTPLKDGGPQDPHFKTVRHARREKSFRRSYGSQLTTRLEKLMKRWSKPRPQA